MNDIRVILVLPAGRIDYNNSYTVTAVEPSGALILETDTGPVRVVTDLSRDHIGAIHTRLRTHHHEVSFNGPRYLTLSVLGGDDI